VQVSVPLNTISFIFTARAAGFLIGSSLSGRVFDRHKAHLYLVACFILQALILAFTPFIADFWMLVGVLFLSGITLGFIVVGASTLIVWEHTHNPAPWVSLQSFLNGVGNFLSPLIISLVISAHGAYARSLWIYALVSIFLAVLFLYTPSPEIRQSESQGAHTKSGHTNKKLVYLVALIFLLYTGSEATYNGWIFSVATTAYPLSDTAARLLNSLFWGALAVGRIFVGILSRRYQPARILNRSIIGAGASFLFAIIFPSSSIILWISTISAGLCMAVIFPTLTLYADKKMQLSSKMSGTFFSATSIGAMVLPWIAGQSFTLINPHWVKGLVVMSLLGAWMLLQTVDRQMHRVA